MVWGLPVALRVLVLYVALPETRATLAETTVPSTRKSTFPVAEPVLGGAALTVAVNVTGWPAIDGFTLEITVTAALAWPTCWPPLRVPLLELKLTVPR